MNKIKTKVVKHETIINKYKQKDEKSSIEKSREKHLLGELYDDKVFLEELFNDDGKYIHFLLNVRGYR